MQIDGIDKTILSALIQDARTPINKLSKEIGISGAAIHQRIKKLEKAKVISGSQVILNPKVLGYKTIAFVGVFLDKAMRNPEAVKHLKEIPEIIECHYTTGNWSIFIKLMCKDNEHLMSVLNTKVQTIEGISRTETFISLEQQIGRQIKP
ncbi:MAG: Lrp/AsnC ligand binding domain-containing protein [Flavobacteriaceae bacterium]|jgi:Lrp/AsnC family transcriptional regulator for asnA, asnC and gidA